MITGSRLRVDLARLRRNVEAVRERMAPADVLVVVKDDAYGHGVEPVVRAAVEAGAGWFGAIDADSALRARAAAGDGARVLCWATAGADEVARIVAADVDSGIGEASHLERVASAAAALGVTARVHLKIDTGLHRNGIRPEDWPTVCARAAALEAEGAVRVVGVWSHIAEASDAADDEARAAFDDAVRVAAAAGLAPEVRHLAASAAAWHRGEFRYDLVRIGAFCYGVRSADGPELDGIDAAAALVAPVTRVDGAAVAVDIGAVDGLFSTLAGRIDVLSPSGPRRLVEVRAFESLVERWPGAAVGDEVVVFGTRASGAATSTDIAERIDTVGEEPLLRLSPLLPREYV